MRAWKTHSQTWDQPSAGEENCRGEQFPILQAFPKRLYVVIVRRIVCGRLAAKMVLYVSGLERPAQCSPTSLNRLRHILFPVFRESLGGYRNPMPWPSGNDLDVVPAYPYVQGIALRCVLYPSNWRCGFFGSEST